MTTIRTYKRKLIMTKAQEQRVLAWIGTCRFIYNMALEIRISAYKTRQEKVHKYELMKQVTQIRDVEWVQDVSVGCLQNTIEKLEKAYQGFFSGKGFPKFASKRSFKSIDFKLINGLGDRFVNLPKFGNLRLFKDSEILGKPKTATIIKEPDGFYVCIYCENVPSRFVSESQTIGLDMGLSHFCIDSNGNFISNPKHFAKYERQLRIENRSLSRKKKGSNSWKRQAKRLSLLNHKIKNVRADFLHKESTKIAKANSIVCLEDLKIKNMARSKSLSKHILDAGWGMFKVMLEYKTTVIKVDPKRTSQTCNECGCIDAESRESQSVFICTNCGHSANADVNAAKNILSRGTALNRQREALACA